MERYVGTKIILAEPMDKASAAFAGLVRGDTVIVEANAKGEPGYKVVYEDGYVSWSPAATFERAYRRVTESELRLLTEDR